MGEVNNRVLQKFKGFRVRKLKWWTQKLTVKSRTIRRLRRKFQRYELSCVMREYKDMLVKIKEEEWRSFVGKNRNDPWGQVYKICRARKREDITFRRVGDTVLLTWKKCGGFC